jgi:hypothetical protein
MKRGGIAIGATLLLCAGTTAAFAQSYGIIVEAVNSYPTKGTLYNRIANADGFYQGMTQPGSNWYLKTRYTDNSVFDTDFIDPDVFSVANDTYNFDQTGAGIAYFSGHGVGDAGTGQPCNHNADCTSPPGNGGYPATCRNIPGAGKTCLYNSTRYIVTESSGDRYGGWVGLNRGGGVAWGESTFSGPWSHAGTNGGINLAIVDISFGILPTGFWEQIGSAFAGVHLWGTIMPTWGDTADVGDRGAKFAAKYQANSAGTVADAWVYTLSSLGGEGMACGGNWANGGGGGINGCGCNIILSVDVDRGHSDAKINVESWNLLPWDNYDSTGAGSMSFEWLCNYDAVTYGWSN